MFLGHSTHFFQQPMMPPELKALELADSSERWEALGFRVTDGSCDLGGVRLELGAEGRGIIGWKLSGIPSETLDIDGLQTAVAEPPAAASAEHPNGAVAVDHVVVTSPDFDRTVTALEAAGMPLRRVAERGDGARMGFRRLGATILELVEAPGRGPVSTEATAGARFWGLVVVVEDLDALTDHLDDRLGPTRKAVQPGRRIATLRESAGLGEAVAFMSPETRP
jgi:hypothetical protein